MRPPSHYNPVCGTDQQTYQNEGRLICYQDCGVGKEKFEFLLVLYSLSIGKNMRCDLICSFKKIMYVKKRKTF